MYHNSWNICAKIAVYLTTILLIVVSGTMLYPIFYLWYPVIYLLCFLMTLTINNDTNNKGMLVLGKLVIMICALLINMFCVWLIDKSSIVPIIILQSLISFLYIMCNYCVYAIIGEKV